MAKEKEVPVILTGINPVVTDVMKRQGLVFSKDCILDADISAGIFRLENMQSIIDEILENRYSPH